MESAGRIAAAVAVMLAYTAAGESVARADSGAMELVTPTARVTVHPRPFRLTVASGHGRPVLRTLGRSRRHGGVTYAGLGYSVGGTEPELSVPVLGDEPAAVPGPVPERHSATRVLRAARQGRALALTLATDDPARRTISLRLAAGPAGTVRLRAAVRGSAGASAVWMGFGSGRGEAFHGFGGRRESTDLRGTSFQSWVLDYRYPDASTGYYAPNPSFVSSAATASCSGARAWRGGGLVPTPRRPGA